MVATLHMRLIKHTLWRATSQPRSRPRAVRVYQKPGNPTTDVRSRGFASSTKARGCYGQPLHETHPHLVRHGDLTPGISAVEYAERRLRLARDLPEGSVAILAGSDIKIRSGAVFYKFHQEPSFFYLTGFSEPVAVAVIDRRATGAIDHAFHLFVRPKDAAKEKWEGSRSGVQAALDIFNADEADDVGNTARILTPILDDATHVFTNFDVQARARSSFSNAAYDAPPATVLALQDILSGTKVKPLTPHINELRAYKSEAEIANMRIAGQASSRGFTESMRRKWSTELDLDGFLEYQFKRNGCDQSAYVPVIAGGKNANQIHYVRNDAELTSGQLVTVDAGGEYGGYVTDITRTWPVNGVFTPPQKDLYDIVLGVQRSCIARCRETACISLDQLHSVAENELRDGLVSLGFDLADKAMETLFPHHLGHYIGLDIHDCPGYSRSGRLRSGQCITIEPGIYVDGSDRWPQHFRNMGIRIEDSVCVEQDTSLVFTSEAVKEVIDIEALRR